MQMLTFVTFYTSLDGTLASYQSLPLSIHSSILRLVYYLFHSLTSVLMFVNETHASVRVDVALS